MASKKTDAKPANDVTTVEGFLAEFAAQYDVLAVRFRWCPSGRSYAYDRLGVNPNQPYAGLPMQGIADEYLTDDGKAAKKAEADGVLGKLREGAVNAAKYGIDAGYAGNDNDRAAFASALNALGIPGQFTTTTTHGFTASAYGATTEQITVTSELTAKVAAAVKAVLEEAGCTVTRDDGSNISSDRRPSTTTTWQDAS